MDKFAQLEKLSELKDKGILSDKEFTNEKNKILHQKPSPKENENSSTVNKLQGAQTYQMHQRNYNTQYNQQYQSISQMKNEFFSFSTFFSPSGRMSRSQYWGVIASYIGFCLVGITILGIIFQGNMQGSSQGIKRIFGFVVIIWYLCLTWSQMVISIKRFHDMNQSGWLVLVPFYNFIGPAFIEGTYGPNKYGPDPIER